MDTPADLLTFIPGIITAIGGLLVMMMAAFKASVRTTFYVTLLVLMAAFFMAVPDLFTPLSNSFGGMVLYGGMASFGTAVILFATFFSVMMTDDYLDESGLLSAELYAMILFATTGMISLATANHLVVLFVGLETMSICLYVMAGFFKNDKKGAEAALKYFLLGAFSTGFLLYGIALLYGATGSLYLDQIASQAENSLLYLAGAALLLTGFFFKISAVPFHMWTPDVYQGTPTTLTGYMSTASKTAAFISMIIVVMRIFGSDGDLGQSREVLQIIAILTMIVGNLVALTQHNVKRMLAYSSIAHAGYLLVGLASGSDQGVSAMLYYLFAYSIMNVGAFGVIAYFERNKGLDFTEVENYAGLGARQPMMAALLSVFLFSLAGIPPFAGFLGKYYVFAAAVRADMILLAVIGVLASATSVYYYLRVMVFMYFRDSHVQPEIRQPEWTFTIGLFILAALTVYYGLEPLFPVDSLFELLSSY